MMILDHFLKSKNGISKRKLLNLIKRFGRPNTWKGGHTLGGKFAWGGYFIVRSDNREINLDQLVRESDNHGHCSYFFEPGWLMRNPWKRIYKRPRQVSVQDAFKLAHKFRDSAGRIRLDRRTRRYYRLVIVGEASEKMTFPEFCRQINGVFPQPPKPKQVEVKA